MHMDYHVGESFYYLDDSSFKSSFHSIHVFIKSAVIVESL